MELETYRKQAERFLIALNGAYYRHYAGHTPDYDLEPIYHAHRDLFGPGIVQGLRDERDRAVEGSEERRRLAMLLDFAAEGCLGEATKAADAELAAREAALEVPVGEEMIRFRALPSRIANEPDPARRAALEQARLAALAGELDPLHRARLEAQHAAARELGWESYAALCADTKELDLPALQAQTQAFLHATAASYPRALEPWVREILGREVSGLQSGDLPRLFRAPGHDSWFTAEQLLPSFATTLAGLGIDLASVNGLALDVEPRPGKSPRAFCAPVRTPGEVYLVIAPIGGRDDYEALLHEGGHAMHASHVDPDLPFEYRHLGEHAVSETYAFTLEHLMATPAWIERHAPGADADQLATFARTITLLYVRRYAGKLAYELELHGPGGAPGPAMAERYRSLLTHATGVPWPGESYLADVDEGLYCTAYLRAWAFEAQLRAHLVERFGERWFEQPQAGALLRRLWSEGQRRRPEELLRELTGEPLGFAALTEWLRA